ncbi:MAG: leucine-rich repeat domain-containing protein [Clostridia bacterium]|nr:leucine-rich repeat domain-containing protein [Clostridia bacterium]
MNRNESFIIHGGVLKKYTGTEAEIILPKEIQKITSYAFADCRALKSIVLPDGLTEIGAFAFIGCENLKEVCIPRSVTKLGDGIFSDCKGLEHFAVSPENTVYRSENDCLIQTSDEKLICGCRNSKIPKKTKEIAPYAFAGCKGLLHAELPDGLACIGDMAFLRCSGLESLSIPETVTKIGKSAFERCLRLREVRLPSGITEIKESTFALCAGLLGIEIPIGVEKIGSAAFAFCKNLKRIHIPESVCKIGALAFTHCRALPYVILPKKLVFAEALGENLPVIGVSLVLPFLNEEMRLQAAAGYAVAVYRNLASYSEEKKKVYLAFILENRAELSDFPKAEGAISLLLNEPEPNKKAGNAHFFIF